MSESEQLRVLYEGIVKQNPSNVEAVHYLAVWHLERQSYLQVPIESLISNNSSILLTILLIFFDRLANTLDIWLHYDPRTLRYGYASHCAVLWQMSTMNVPPPHQGLHSC